MVRIPCADRYSDQINYVNKYGYYFAAVALVHRGSTYRAFYPGFINLRQQTFRSVFIVQAYLRGLPAR